MTALDISEQIDRKYAKDLERIKKFCLMDDDFFTKCFEGNTACIELVLRIVLEKQDLKVLDVRTQVFIENILDHSVRFDVVATDDAGKKYDIEIQRRNQGASRKRARYHSSMMDANFLQKSTDFDKLPETYVIFITEHDVMGKGLPLYSVERYILETGEKFEDDSHIIYVKGSYRDESTVGKLMSDFFCTDTKEMNYGVLAERVSFFKETKEGVLTMCKILEDVRNEGINIGRNEGAKESLIETVKEMLSDGVPLEKIVKYSKLSVDEVKKIRDGRMA